MKNIKLPLGRGYAFAAVSAVCLVLSACSSTSSKPGGPGMSDNAQYSGFLADYSKLQPVTGSSSAKSWRDPAANFASYDKILLERIRVSLKADNAEETVDPTQLKALVDYFHEALVRELSDAYPIVSEPGPGVLRVRIAITNLVPTKPEMSVIALVVPYATIADLASGVADGHEAGSPAYVGSTGIEAEFLDSQTSRVIGEYVDDQIGRKYVVDTSGGIENAITTGFSQYSKAYTSWGYAKEAFDTWAKLLRTRLDQLHQTR
jgi:hypothetical protein